MENGKATGDGVIENAQNQHENFEHFNGAGVMSNMSAEKSTESGIWGEPEREL